MLALWQALLALIAHNTHQRAALARALVSAEAVAALTRAPEWAPTPRAWALAARQVGVLTALGIHVVPAWELSARLRAARPPPPALFVRGDATLLAARAIAIVGARDAHDGPRLWAAARAREAARAGLLVVSGGARGIDTAAHAAALAAQGRTLAYLGVPADRIYPAHNQPLFERILLKGGCLVSEHPPLVTTFATAHACRNRLIAAHAEHVLVAEAAATSGSLGTARCALRLGVPVWVSPDSVGGARAGISALLVVGADAHVLEGSFADAGAGVRAAGPSSQLQNQGPSG